MIIERSIRFSRNKRVNQRIGLHRKKKQWSPMGAWGKEGDQDGNFASPWLLGIGTTKILIKIV